MHCAKEKKRTLKRAYIYDLLRKRHTTYILYLLKNDGNCDIAVKERKTFQRNAIVKFWRKRQSGEGIVLGKSVI